MNLKKNETGFFRIINNNIFSSLKGLVVTDNGDKNYELLGKFKDIYSWHLDQPSMSFDHDLFSKTKNEWFDVAKIVNNYQFLKIINFVKLIIKNKII